MQRSDNLDLKGDMLLGAMGPKRENNQVRATTEPYTTPLISLHEDS